MLENNHTIHLTLNGESRAFTVEPQETLLHVLRERAHLTGAKKGCDLGECGACTVIMDGRAVNSCCVFAIEADGRSETSPPSAATSCRTAAAFTSTSRTCGAAALPTASRPAAASPPDPELAGLPRHLLFRRRHRADRLRGGGRVHRRRRDAPHRPQVPHRAPQRGKRPCLP